MREHRDRWPGRLERMARLIPESSRVLDAGCGAQGLERLLPYGCYYRGIDLPEFDLDRDLWPRGFDVVVLSGVLEYLTKPQRALRQARYVAPVILVSYAHRPKDVTARANCLTRGQIRRLAAAVGLHTQRVGHWWGQDLYRMSRGLPCG